MGLGQKFLTGAGSGQFFVARLESGRVSHFWFGFRFGKITPKNIKIFNFFPSDQKVPWSKAGWPLFYCMLKVC